MSMLFTALLALSMAAAQENKQQVKDPGDDLIKWETKCAARGCILQTDVIRGNSGNPPDIKDTREYIGIDIALERSTQKPAYIAIVVDPRVKRDQGVFITFSKTTMEHGQWKMNLDPQGPSRLPIADSDCKDDGCTVRVPEGLVDDGPDRHKTDLLQRFLDSDHMLVLYIRDGKAYRTMVILSSFKKEYQRVMADEMKPAEPAK
jgi:hypothetical protein